MGSLISKEDFASFRQIEEEYAKLADRIARAAAQIRDEMDEIALIKRHQSMGKLDDLYFKEFRYLDSVNTIVVVEYDYYDGRAEFDVPLRYLLAEDWRSIFIAEMDASSKRRVEAKNKRQAEKERKERIEYERLKVKFEGERP